MGKVKTCGAPRVTTDKLQRVLNIAACILTGTHRFDRGLSWLLHTELHWLDIPERVVYKLGVTMFSCQHGRAPQYLIRLPSTGLWCGITAAPLSASQRLLGRTVSPHIVAGLLQWLARRSGTVSQTVCRIQMLPHTTTSTCENVFVFSIPVQLTHRVCYNMCSTNLHFTYVYNLHTSNLANDDYWVT